MLAAPLHDANTYLWYVNQGFSRVGLSIYWVLRSACDKNSFGSFALFI